MQTMDMGSAETGLTQMAHIPSASSSSYFLQLDPSGQIDILESSLVLSKPDMREETVYEIQLDQYVMDDRNVGNVEFINLQNLQNFQNTVTFQPTEILAEPQQQFATTFDPQQFQFQIDDLNLQQILINSNAFQQATTVPPMVNQVVEEDLGSVPDFTVETEIVSEVEAEPLTTAGANVGLVDNSTFSQFIIPDIQPYSGNVEANAALRDDTNLGSQLLAPEPLDVKVKQEPDLIEPKTQSEIKQEAESMDVDSQAFGESEKTVKVKDQPPDHIMEFAEDPVMPPLVEMYPSFQSSETDPIEPPQVTIYDSDDEDGTGDDLNSEKNFQSKFLPSGMDPDDELYISFLSRPDSNKTAMCVLCYDWFDSVSSLSEHLLSTHQDNMKLYGCKKCGKKFWSRFLRQRHEKLHRFDLKGPLNRYFPKSRPFDHYESKHFYKRLRPAPISERYREHLKLVHCEIKGMEFDCIQCGKDFSSEEEYREHYEEHHALQTCVHCREIFENAKHLRRHVEKAHGNHGVKKNYPGGAWKLWETWDCDEMKKHDECTVSMYLDHNYNKRTKVEQRSGEEYTTKNCDTFMNIGCEEITIKEYEASKLPKSSEKRKSIDKPQNSSKTSQKHSSTSKSESTKGRKSTPKSKIDEKLDDYDRIQFVEEAIVEEPVIKISELPFKCHTCRTSFNDEEDLQLHLKSHAIRSMAYMCQYCGRGFATHSNRKEHERIHTGDKPYVCPICNRAFVQISNLKKHIQTHKEKNNLQCTTCAKQFVKESSLILHQRAHSQDRKFRCHICDRAYNYASLLKRHMRIHTGENPYSCEDCGQQFHELVSLHYHRKKVHTGERPHRCDICGRAFILSSDLKKHLKIHLRDSNNIKSASGAPPNSKSVSSGSGEETMGESDSMSAPSFPGTPEKINEVTAKGALVCIEGKPIDDEIVGGSRVLLISGTDLLNLTENEKTSDGLKSQENTSELENTTVFNETNIGPAS